ncbi:MAG: cytochrome-c peroxidase [endosymbiont of Galathealinum brachiosum]|uniref:Cytochrome-c peroxidase n=1 Tax=endosymbiont of Galathealinum brachiosum TaxID=2200906 RepID=A0A370DIN1_9GAMM|nr:MAG: cytochrome-c peroxidase [endosymbiont of Galathealinum brachiosum]
MFYFHNYCIYVAGLIMKMRLLVLLVLGVSVSSCGDSGGGASRVDTIAAMQALGKNIFFDTNLSSNSNQSCASCHDPLVGFADPRVSSAAPVSEGSEAGAFGDRNAPTAAYAFFSPFFTNTTTHTTPDGTVSNYQGGQFLDGRRINLREQAKDPFLNPVEMNNADSATVVTKVSNSSYADDFIAMFGSGAFDDTDIAYNNIARAIAAFEASAEVNKFSSKFDDVQNGTATFNDSELRGFNLFKGTKAKCANCHTVPDTGTILFTNHRFYNVGTPSNGFNPAVVANSSFIDNGLGGTTDVVVPGDEAAEVGKFRIPTLRNIALTAPYMHNGVFQTLEDVIRHYDLKMQFATAEVNSNIANEVAFDDSSLGLSPEEITDLVSFMETLTDQ